MPYIVWNKKFGIRKEELVNYLKNNLSNDFEILYRPHPSEFEKFSNDFYPNFYIDGIKVIDNDLDVKSIAYLSDFHISMFQGVTHYSLAFNKKLIIPKNNFGVKNEMNMDLFKEKEFSFEGAFSILDENSILSELL